MYLAIAILFTISLAIGLVWFDVWMRKTDPLYGEPTEQEISEIIDWDAPRKL